ncbi:MULTISPECIES: NifU family protein [Myroides]|uniref:NifU family protein n=1 Tax=Myroides albus TaxID=2562892 RepID=A0A6I3LF39_9FLAO|nr:MULTISPECIES: NifU family protein [Myroides]MTG96823.1 NifU family protein [Myroides albus]MVX36928.1 NifU family protein [Myroides sp. LoEW2-1]UVD78427.1 NifU family protein [Myroides albus]
MSKIQIQNTSNPTIIKFVLPDFITKGENFEFKNIDETANSPLARELFYLPFVKTVYISNNFIAIEKFSIVEWDDVKETVADQIDLFLAKGKKILIESKKEIKKQPITIYAESTPNPSVIKFVANKLLTKKHVEYKNIDEATSSPLAKELFKQSFVKEVFIDENYISISKFDAYDWNEFINPTRGFIKEFLENGNLAVEEALLNDVKALEAEADKHFDSLDEKSQRIVNILEENVKPAVQADGGNIAFQKYDQETNTVHVVLQGACSGCPSSTFTLKNGIEGMLRHMLNDEAIIVEAYNG